jgi:hypothetical protein
MLELRRSADRGVTRTGWLDSRHTFSFADYHDPKHVHFRALRVLNEDLVAPGTGFPMHAHRDMEILTWLIAGELAHQDSMGNGSTIRPGEIQRMSAGTGVLHSESNPSRTETTHLLQIWILPGIRGLKPSYEQRAYPAAERRGRLRLIASSDGRDGSVALHQDVAVYATLLGNDDRAALSLRPGRHGWVQAARGEVLVNGQRLAAGDGAAVSDEPALALAATTAAELLVFDLA